MSAIIFLCCALALLAGSALAIGLWHRRHPGLAAHSVRQWWVARGWTWTRPGYLTLHLVLGLAAAAAMLALFAAISDRVADGAAITRFDVQFDNRLHAMATPFGLRIATAISLVGGPGAMALLGIAGAVYLFVRVRDRVLFLGWVIAIGGGGLLDWVLKTTFHRPRPMFADPFAHGYGFSFPSGHSMGSVIGLGMLAYLIVRHLRHESPRVAIIALAGVLCAAIGVSRLYLGVHFPSDVLGGFAAGLMWLATCISGLEIVQDRELGTGSLSHVRTGAPTARAGP